MTIISPLPYTFVNGTTIDATQVNADFAQVVANANANAAHLGANSDITSLAGLTTPLSTAQGGTGRSTGAPCVLAFGTPSVNVPAGVTQYFAIAVVSGNPGLVLYVIPVAGTLKNLYGQAGAAPGGVETYTYTLMKNGVATALTCQTTDSQSQSHDTTHSASVIAGDLINIRIVPSAGAVDAIHSAFLEFDITP